MRFFRRTFQVNLQVRIFIFTSVLLLFACKQQVKTNDSPIQYASLDSSTNYAGIQACKECHSDKYSTYIETGMGLSFDHASRNKSSALFTKDAIIRDTFQNLFYHPFWQGDSLRIIEFRLQGKDTVFKRMENISWIIGSGQHTNSHLMNVNGYVYQVPATFYTQKSKWDLPPGFEGGFNSRFSRKIGLECMSCHNAYPKMIEGSENKYSYVANGIDCERCHGPGERHVSEKKSGKIIDVEHEIDYTIVNPAKLSIDLQMDICQRCHIQGNAVLKAGKSFFDFKPGMKLSDVMDVYMPLYEGDENSHIMASHAERLKMSKCFLQSLKNAEAINKSKPNLKPYSNALTCVTCHDPHISIKHTDKSIINTKCVSCHQQKNELADVNNLHSRILVCTEKKGERIKSKDNCTGCHMPKGGSTDIPHVTTTDHRIGIYTKSEDVRKIKEFAGLICINNTNPDQRSKGEAFISYFEKFSSNPAFLDSAKNYFKDDNQAGILSSFRQLIHLYYLKDDFKKVVAYAESYPTIFDSLNKRSFSNTDAWTAYRIGESFSANSNNTMAVKYFSRAVELAPYVLDFRNKLAGKYFDLNKMKEAKNEYEFIIRENPRFTSAYVSLGFLVLSVDKNTALADSYYDKALALDPDNLQAFLNKAGLMLYLGKKPQAVTYLREILKRNPSHIQAKALLTQLTNTQS